MFDLNRFLNNKLVLSGQETLTLMIPLCSIAVQYDTDTHTHKNTLNNSYTFTHNFLCILTHLQQHNIISDNGRIAGMVYVDRSLSTIQFSDKPRILANVLLNN